MFYNFYRDNVHADEAELLYSSRTDFLRFSCSDHFIFDVDCVILSSSNVIQNIQTAQNNSSDERSCSSSEQRSHKLNAEAISIPFEAYIFKRTLDFVIQGSELSPPMNAEDLLSSLRIADYFDMESLKAQVIAELSSLINTPCITTVRRRLSIQSDFSKSEMRQMLLEEMDIPISEDPNNNDQ